MGAYDDILHLPHHRSEKHPSMSMRDRAAQFSSFRALAGYEDAIGETARLTDRRIERGEEERHRLDAILRKAGGAYLQHSGPLHAIDRVNCRLIFADKSELPLDDIYDIIDTP